MTSEEEPQEQQQQDRRRVEITTRDIDTLRFIGEQYAVRLDQLCTILGRHPGAGTGSHTPQTPGKLSESAMRVWLRRMKQLGAIEHKLIYHGEPGYVWLTPYGLKLAELAFTPLIPAESTLHHCYWCNQARLYLEMRRPLDTWRAERYLRSDHARETNQRRKGIEPPDAVLQTEKGGVAIEIERTDKQAARVEGIVSKRAMSYYTVWYFCSKQTRQLVEAAKAKLPPDLRQKIIIYDLADLETVRDL